MIQDLLTSNDGINRTKDRVKQTGEVFTPFSIIEEMMSKIDEAIWKNPKANFLEPCCGNGQIVIGMLNNRVKHGVDPLQAVKTMYAVELMPDNLNMCKERVLDFLRNNGVKITNSILKTVDNNFVCHDFFDWDFENWRAKTEDQKRLEKLNDGQVNINDTPFAEFLG